MYRPMSPQELQRRNAAMETLGQVAGDYGRSFGAGALQLGANIGDAMSTGNSVSNKLNEWATDVESGYSPFAKNQLSQYDTAVKNYQHDGYDYLTALGKASFDYPYAAGMTVTKEIAPGVVVPYARGLAAAKYAKPAATTLNTITHSMPAMAMLGGLDGMGEVNRDYYEKTGDRYVPLHISAAGAAAGAIGTHIGNAAGEGAIPLIKDWTPDTRTAILSPTEPLPQKQLWGL